MKRIIKNLACQEHKYMYCPQCKAYEEVDYDPLENMEKFMKFIKAEQRKINPPPKTKKELPPEEKRKDRALPDDSVSEITDLE
mmetsp:Transcript_5862/g.9471  ORF Transcript_5862/g.9471 Transcript_5862/m.9471 type:complete len:83 (+) Transcript_5862:2600-2848(+)